MHIIKLPSFLFNNNISEEEEDAEIRFRTFGKEFLTDRSGAFKSDFIQITPSLERFRTSGSSEIEIGFLHLQQYYIGELYKK